MTDAPTRTMLVTGGAKGLGAGICRRAAHAGYAVAVLDLERGACATLVKSLPARALPLAVL